MSHPTRRLALRRLLAVGLVLALGLAGCGLSADGEPRVIAAENVPPDLLDPNPPTSTTLPGSAATAMVTVYLVVRQGETTRLVPVEREVATGTNAAARAADRVNALLQPTSAEEQQLGLISSIPTDTVLLDIAAGASDNELVVNLSGALFDVQGKELANAFAQIVWTVTERDGVRLVRFKVDGEAYRAPNAAGIEQQGAVSRADYASLAPTG